MQDADKEDRSKLDVMNHPAREEWMSYLYEELPAETRTRLDSHLEACRACERLVAEWQKTMESLDRWKIPVPRDRPAVWQPFLKWGIAVLFMVSLGYGAGRVSVPATDMDNVRAGIETSLRASLEREIRDQIRDELKGELRNFAALTEQRLTNRLSQVYASMNELAEKTLLASTDQAQRLLAVYDDKREDERQATWTALGNLNTWQRRFGSEFASFRKEVETMAVLTEDNFQRVQLASHSGAGAPDSNLRNNP